MTRRYRCPDHGDFTVDVTGDDSGEYRDCPACGRSCAMEYTTTADVIAELNRTNPNRGWFRPRREFRGPYYSAEKGQWFSSRREIDDWYKKHDAWPMLDSDIKKAQEDVAAAHSEARREEAEVKKTAAELGISSGDFDADL